MPKQYKEVTTDLPGNLSKFYVIATKPGVAKADFERAFAAYAEQLETSQGQLPDARQGDFIITPGSPSAKLSAQYQEYTAQPRQQLGEMLGRHADPVLGAIGQVVGIPQRPGTPESGQFLAEMLIPRTMSEAALTGATALTGIGGAAVRAPAAAAGRYGLRAAQAAIPAATYGTLGASEGVTPTEAGIVGGTLWGVGLLGDWLLGNVHPRVQQKLQGKLQEQIKAVGVTETPKGVFKLGKEAVDDTLDESVSDIYQRLKGHLTPEELVEIRKPLVKLKAYRDTLFTSKPGSDEFKAASVSFGKELRDLSNSFVKSVAGEGKDRFENLVLWMQGNNTELFKQIVTESLNLNDPIDQAVLLAVTGKRISTDVPAKALKARLEAFEKDFTQKASQELTGEIGKAFERNIEASRVLHLLNNSSDERGFIDTRLLRKYLLDNPDAVETKSAALKDIITTALQGETSQQYASIPGLKSALGVLGRPGRALADILRVPSGQRFLQRPQVGLRPGLSTAIDIAAVKGLTAQE